MNLKHHSNKTFLIVSLCLLSGCASVFQGAEQNIIVVTDNNKSVSGTRCTIKNEEGVWNTVPQARVSIHRDDNVLEIQCKNATQTGINQIAPDFNVGYLGADLLLSGCTISCLIDGINNAFYQYPPFITVPMK